MPAAGAARLSPKLTPFHLIFGVGVYFHYSSSQPASAAGSGEPAAGIFRAAMPKGAGRLPNQDFRFPDGVPVPVFISLPRLALENPIKW